MATTSAGRSAIISTSIPTCRPRSRSSSRRQEEVNCRRMANCGSAYAPSIRFRLADVTLHAQREAQAGREAENLDLPGLLDRPMPDKALAETFRRRLYLPARRTQIEGWRPRALLGHGRRQQGTAPQSLRYPAARNDPRSIVAPGQAGQHDQQNQPNAPMVQAATEREEARPRRPGEPRPRMARGFDGKRRSPKGEKLSDDKPNARRSKRGKPQDPQSAAAKTRPAEQRAGQGKSSLPPMQIVRTRRPEFERGRGRAQEADPDTQTSRCHQGYPQR